MPERTRFPAWLLIRFRPEPFGLRVSFARFRVRACPGLASPRISLMPSSTRKAIASNQAPAGRLVRGRGSHPDLRGELDLGPRCVGRGTRGAVRDSSRAFPGLLTLRPYSEPPPSLPPPPPRRCFLASFSPLRRRSRPLLLSPGIMAPSRWWRASRSSLGRPGRGCGIAGCGRSSSVWPRRLVISRRRSASPRWTCHRRRGRLRPPPPP